MQRDTLRALLFVLFIRNYIAFFEDRVLSGLQVCKERDLQMILYADDLVLLDVSWHVAQRKLQCLHKYCLQYGRTVNSLGEASKVFPYISFIF